MGATYLSGEFAGYAAKTLLAKRFGGLTSFIGWVVADEAASATVTMNGRVGAGSLGERYAKDLSEGLIARLLVMGLMSAMPLKGAWLKFAVQSVVLAGTGLVSQAVVAPMALCLGFEVAEEERIDLSKMSLEEWGDRIVDSAVMGLKGRTLRGVSQGVGLDFESESPHLNTMGYVLAGSLALAGSGGAFAARDYGAQSRSVDPNKPFLWGAALGVVSKKKKKKGKTSGQEADWQSTLDPTVARLQKRLKTKGYGKAKEILMTQLKRSDLDWDLKLRLCEAVLEGQQWLVHDRKARLAFYDTVREGYRFLSQGASHTHRRVLAHRLMQIYITLADDALVQAPLDSRYYDLAERYYRMAKHPTGIVEVLHGRLIFDKEASPREVFEELLRLPPEVRSDLVTKLYTLYDRGRERGGDLRSLEQAAWRLERVVLGCEVLKEKGEGAQRGEAGVLQNLAQMELGRVKTRLQSEKGMRAGRIYDNFKQRITGVDRLLSVQRDLLDLISMGRDYLVYVGRSGDLVFDRAGRYYERGEWRQAALEYDMAISAYHLLLQAGCNGNGPEIERRLGIALLRRGSHHWTETSRDIVSCYYTLSGFTPWQAELLSFSTLGKNDAVNFLLDGRGEVLVSQFAGAITKQKSKAPAFLRREAERLTDMAGLVETRRESLSQHEALNYYVTSASAYEAVGSHHKAMETWLLALHASEHTLGNQHQGFLHAVQLRISSLMGDSPPLS